MLNRQSLLIFSTGAILLVAAYWAGLHGPFLLDDFENLAPLWRYLDGELTGAGAVLGNHSGPLGRPLSMLSFLIDARVWGRDAFGFKLTNLLIHLACAGLIWRLLALFLPRDPKLSHHARWLAPALAMAWAILPIHVSTVLYVVQRMAMLSGLFVLIALLVYVHGRRLAEAKNERAALWLGLVFPALTVVAALCKENGVLAVPLAAAIEFTCFRPTQGKRPWLVRALFLVALAAPLLLLVAAVAVEPTRLTNGYIGRSFTLVERILTEPRILWEYARLIVAPNGPRMGLFHDNYPVSHGLMSPRSTWIAILAWGLAVSCAWLARRKSPIFSLGVLFFLAAHAMESTVLPLELYFEHRNYLASLGIVVAIAALPGLLIREGAQTPAMRMLLVSVACLLPVGYLLATHFRAAVWSSEDTLYVQEELNNATSPRLQGILAARAIERGDLRAALKHIDLSEKNGPASEQMTATVRRMLAYCATGHAIPETHYAQAEARTGMPLTQYGMVAWEMLAQRAENGICSVNRSRLARIGQDWSDNSGAPPQAHAAWRTRYNSGRLLAATGEMDAAAALALRSYRDSGSNFGVGVFAFQACASSHPISQCADIARQLADSADPRDLLAIKTARQFLHASQTSIPSPTQQ